MEEQDRQIPKPTQLNEHMVHGGPGYCFLIRHYAQLERVLLRMVDFRLMMPTAPLFTPYFLSIRDDQNSLQTFETDQFWWPTVLLGLDNPSAVTPFHDASLLYQYNSSLLKSQLEEATNGFLKLSLKGI